MNAYIAAMEEPGRAQWQKPDTVVNWLGLKPGMTACDVGAGPGYFSLRLAAQVGPSGRVYAVDVEPAMLASLVAHLDKQGLHQVTPVLGRASDPLLPAHSCDVILVVDTYHHFPDRVAYLRTLAGALKPGGTLWLVDFHKRKLPVGPPVERKIAAAVVEKEAAAAGFGPALSQPGLPYQYALKFSVR